LLADLRRLREIQVEQAEALGRGDLERLTELDALRREVQARIVPADAPPLDAADLAEARALMALLARDQDALTERAVAVRESLRRQLRSLGTGRQALAGYRPPAAGSSVLLDRSY
jgi:hypothetical protein